MPSARTGVESGAGVDLQPVPGDRVDRIVGGQEEQVRPPCPGDRRVGSCLPDGAGRRREGPGEVAQGEVAQARDDLARGDAWQPLGRDRPAGGGKQRHPGQGLDERLGNGGPAGLDEHRYGGGEVHAGPAVRLGDRQAEHPHLGQPRPQPGHPPVGGVPGCSQRLRGTVAREHVAHTRRELQRVVGRQQSHGHARGNPRTRSATTLRCTSLVPA